MDAAGDYDLEPGDVVADGAAGRSHVTAATRRPSTLEQYASYSSAQLSDTEATSVSAYDSDASVDDEEESYAIEDVMARGAPRAYAGASGGAHKAHRSDFGPSETDDSSDYGQNMLASETTGAGDDNMKPAHRRRFQWGPARCCVSYRIGALTVVADYHDALGRSTKLMLGPYWPYMVVTAVTVSVITALVYHVERHQIVATNWQTPQTPVKSSTTRTSSYRILCSLSSANVRSSKLLCSLDVCDTRNLVGVKLRGFVSCDGELES